MDGVTLACSVCGLGNEESRWAYVAMTIFLSAVPLLMIAAGWVWVIKRMHAAEVESSKTPSDKTSGQAQGD